MELEQVVLDATTVAEIVQNLAEKLKANYVYPDVAEQICARLRYHLDDGAYADSPDGEFLAFALTTHLQEVNQDEHLWVKWTPEPLPEQEGALRENEAWLAERRQRAELDNYGLHKVERLPGNVGYLEIRRFEKPVWGGDTAAAAMGFLAHAQALIVDLRKCTGGYPGMVVLISSYLFGEEPVHLNSMYWRDEDATQQYWTLPHVPGERFGDKPVYVLTSQDTFSGGEEFAYNLQSRQRATLVGETTGGGAHAGASYRLHPHFEAFIPMGRAINPITQENWEGRGVVPDFPVAAEKALDVAYRLALESVLERVGDARSGPFIWLLAEAEAALAEMDTPSPRLTRR
jgi:C-terminal processing protease CtpA/Prc